MAHWHDFNPWADVLVYLPDIDEAAACIRPTDPHTVKQRWLRCGKKLDIYILPQPSGWHDFGVRFGPKPEQYLSPHIDRYIANLLLSKYAPDYEFELKEPA
jgi:hypothetical protein